MRPPTYRPERRGNGTTHGINHITVLEPDMDKLAPVIELVR
jgi:hypothetical protein